MPELPIHAPALSVQLPSRARPQALAACVRSLAQQSLDPAHYEIIVGLDGPDEPAARAAREAWGSLPAPNLRVLDFPRAGHLPIRRAMVSMTTAPIVVFMNDDVVPDPGFLAAHLHAHRAAQDAPVTSAPARPHGVMVVGQTPWAVPPDDTLFDRLVRQTSLIFFYDQMDDARHDRDRDWGFRHFWTLNASAPRAAIQAVGGLLAIPHTYGHEDIELAFRLHQRFQMPVLYRPEARATHHHRYRPADVMQREVNLGTASWRFARANPAFTLALFGRDITSNTELAYSREFVEQERSAAQRLATDFEALAAMPGDAAGSGPLAVSLLPILSRQFLLLKRHLWRRGLLAACQQEPP